MSPILVIAAGVLVVASVRDGGGRAPTDPGATAAVIATVDLPAGIVVGPDDVAIRRLPGAALPATATSEPDEVVGRQVTATILAGEPVVGARLAPDGLVGVAAATPPTWSAFALPVDATLPPVEVGQAVDLYALDGTDPGLAVDDARRVARAASVVAVEDQRVTVAVRPDDAPSVAATLIGATVVVAVTGPSSPDGTSEGP